MEPVPKTFVACSQLRDDTPDPYRKGRRIRQTADSEFMSINDNDSLERSRSLLDIAVRDFVPKCSIKFQRLVPFRDQIAALRVKHASYRIIAALLQSASINSALLKVFLVKPLGFAIV